MTTCQLTALRSCYCPLWVSPSRLAVDHRHETSRLPLAKRIYSAPYGRTDNVVVDVSLVDVGADDESVLALGESPGQLHAKPVGFLRRDLARHKGLPQVVGNHIVRTAHPAGAGDIGLLVQQELGVGYAAVTLIAGDEPAVVGLFWIFYIVDDVADRLAGRAALAGVQRHDTGGGHVGALLSPGVRAKKKQETVP